MSRQGMRFIPIDSYRRPDIPGLEAQKEAFERGGGKVQVIPFGKCAINHEGGLKEASERKANVVLGGKRKPTKAQQMKITRRDEE